MLEMALLRFGGRHDSSDATQNECKQAARAVKWLRRLRLAKLKSVIGVLQAAGNLLADAACRCQISPGGRSESLMTA